MAHHRLAKAHVTRTGHAKVDRRKNYAPYVDGAGHVREFKLKRGGHSGSRRKGQTPAQHRASLRNLAKGRAKRRQMARAKKRH